MKQGCHAQSKLGQLEQMGHSGAADRVIFYLYSVKSQVQTPSVLVRSTRMRKKTTKERNVTDFNTRRNRSK